MAAYFIAQVSIKDRDAYQAYEQGFMAILDEHGGQLVSVDEQPLVLEGDWACTRTVLLRFETAEAGETWYHSDAYQTCLLYTSPSPRDATLSRMPSSA